jgi:uncharacterized membrane protein YphA (DoxX/SURF4 family)
MWILRAFLGVTFMYAGIQKLADPNFFHAGTPDFIGSQLRSFGQGSPIHGVIGFFGHFPALTGLGVALTETAVGLATLLGIGAILAAGVGFAINLILFLSATWHVHPYFLGSDSIYAVAWLAYLAGLVDIERQVRAAPIVGTHRQRTAAIDAGAVGRREFLRGGLVAVGTLILGAAATTVSGSPARALRTLASPSPTLRGTPRTQKHASTAVEGTPIAKLDPAPGRWSRFVH